MESADDAVSLPLQTYSAVLSSFRHTSEQFARADYCFTSPALPAPIQQRSPCKAACATMLPPAGAAVAATYLVCEHSLGLAATKLAGFMFPLLTPPQPPNAEHHQCCQ